MAKIRRDRLIEAGFVVRNDSAQARQPVEPLAKRRRRRRPRQFEHGVEGVLQGALPGTFQGLVHGGSLGFLGLEAGLLRKFWQERPREAIWPGKSVFRRSGYRFAEENASKINIRAPFRFNRNGKGANARLTGKQTRKNRERAFPKQSCVGTYAPHPRALARVAFSGSLRTGSAPQALAKSFRFFRRRATVYRGVEQPGSSSGSYPEGHRFTYSPRTQDNAAKSTTWRRSFFATSIRRRARVHASFRQLDPENEPAISTFSHHPPFIRIIPRANEMTITDTAAETQPFQAEVSPTLPL